MSAHLATPPPGRCGKKRQRVLGPHRLGATTPDLCGFYRFPAPGHGLELLASWQRVFHISCNVSQCVQLFKLPFSALLWRSQPCESEGTCAWHSSFLQGESNVKKKKKKRNVLTCQKANLVCLLKFKNKTRTRLSPFTVLLLREPGPGLKVTKRYLRRVLQQMKAVQLRKVSLPEAHLLQLETSRQRLVDHLLDLSWKSVRC